jgi:hypothetical protein
MEFFKTMRTKMLEIDPELADIVKKRSVERKAHRAWGDQGGLDGLSDDERQKLLSVMEQVDSDPAVEAANKKRWEASSADDPRIRPRRLSPSVARCHGKVDPSIAPILDKLSTEARTRMPSRLFPQRRKTTGCAPRPAGDAWLAEFA